MVDILNRGSRWLRCDLHVHTPASFFHQYGDSKDEATWEQFVAELEALPVEFKVVGINDYVTLDGYKKILDYKSQGRLKNIVCLLPVIEFRINRFAGESKLRRINYHVIFSDEIDVDTIQSQFLNSIASSYTLESGSPDPDWSAALTDDSFIDLGQRLKKRAPGNTSLQNETDWKVGFSNFNVDYGALKTILAKPQFLDRVVTAIGKGEWDDFRWDAGGAAEKRSIINEADIIFISSATPEHYDKAKAKLKRDQVNHTLLDCSDAHYYSGSNEKDRIGNCNTWLKIEPSFDGLKQILFESEDRIRVSEVHPDQKAPYQTIANVRFVNGGRYFTNEPIKLSSGLNAVIGGKSTGKSLLAGLIVKSSDPSEYAKRKGTTRLRELNWIEEKQPGVDFRVHWKDGGETSLRNNNQHESRKITYFPQHYLNAQINDKGAGNKELNKIIRDILSQTPIYRDAFLNYEKARQGIDQEIAADSSHFETKLRDLRGMKKLQQEKGKSADIKKNIDRLNQELSELKSQYDLSEEEIEKHHEITSCVKDLQEEKKIIDKNINVLSEANRERITQSLQLSELLGSRYEELSDAVNAEIEAQLAKLTPEYVDNVYGIVAESLREQQGKRSAIEARIKEKEEEHAPILLKIRNSAPLREKNKLIHEESAKLDEMKKIEDRIGEFDDELDKLTQRLGKYIERKIQCTELVKQEIKEHPFADQDDQLGIVVEHKCQAGHVQDILKDRVKYQSNSKIRKFINDDEFGDNDVEAYTERLAIVLDQARSDTLELKGENKISRIVQDVLSDAIYLNYDLKLGQDSFSIMSPGKRALALLRVLVELDQSQHPIILDQPEDDLDNRSVYEGLAKYLKKKKNDRQIIVVTHNPNVVVGADSEHVIVANQSGQESNQDNRSFHFEYIYGGLENSFEDADTSYILERQGIREHVCEILDGGEAAFGRRERLYSGFRRRLLMPRDVDASSSIAAE